MPDGLGMAFAVRAAVGLSQLGHLQQVEHPSRGRRVDGVSTRIMGGVEVNPPFRYPFVVGVLYTDRLPNMCVAPSKEGRPTAPVLLIRPSGRHLSRQIHRTNVWRQPYFTGVRAHGCTLH